MIQRRELNDIETLIIEVIEKNPGCTQYAVHEHLLTKYRSREYVRSSIKRLIAMGKIQDTGTGQAASLYCTVTNAQ
jgi:hypothetical protein